MPEKKKLVVAKFGGTSLQSAECREKAVDHCRALMEGTEKLIIVVSAMGRQGDPYATDSLLNLLSEESSTGEKDRLMACGEVISAMVMASSLRAGGLQAEALTGWEAGIKTDGVAGNARIVSVETSLIEKALESAQAVVIAGFQGVDRHGKLNTLGRGGADTTAVVLGVALKADEVLLFKTVESIYTADPEKVPFAKKLTRISAEDLRHMAWQGAKVVHPRAAEASLSAELPILVRSFCSGNVVTEVVPKPLEDTRYIVGVAAGPVVSGFTVGGSGKPSVFFARLFSRVAALSVSMDMFSVWGCSAAFTVPEGDTGKVSALIEEMECPYTVKGPCAKVSIVGAGMHGLKGVMARFCRALDSAGIDALQTVDSHATISALVSLEDRDSALAVLHREFVE
ncbi:aspartate kinase [Candidatus Fermentibacteria bacterium]|nr:MAG: aspartate kinase [Candidatus Fermentibacteria bacterium]